MKDDIACRELFYGQIVHSTPSDCSEGKSGQHNTSRSPRDYFSLFTLIDLGEFLVGEITLQVITFNFT